MSKQELESAIIKVADALDKSKEEIAAKLIDKDVWTWFLVKQAAQ